MNMNISTYNSIHNWPTSDSYISIAGAMRGRVQQFNLLEPNRIIQESQNGSINGRFVR